MITLGQTCIGLLHCSKHLELRIKELLKKVLELHHTYHPENI